MEEKLSFLISFIDVSIVVIFFALVLIGISWIFRKIKSDKDSINIIKNSIVSLIVLVGILAFILALPIDKNLKGQIISFLGIIMSAAIALSSATLLGNLIAGIMNSSINRFNYGDLIKITDLQGRVTKKSAFHVEIQTEDSNFITMPNLFIASNPVKLTRKTKTVISTTISLGYDVSRVLVESYLKDAALNAGLTDPFVYLIDLGDYSITYKVHGFLGDSDNFFSSRSLLNEKVVDVLHENKIEIVSPTFMNQRRVDEISFIPVKKTVVKPEEKEISPEEMIFDKADKSEAIENTKHSLKKTDKLIEELENEVKNLSDDKEIEKTKLKIQTLKQSKEKILVSINKQKEKLDEVD